MRVGDGDLNVRSAGSGAPFLWAHGLMSSMETEDALDILRWRHFPASLRLVRYDARGHGASAPSSGSQQHTWPQLARDMLAVADGAGAGTFIAGGWSMGAATALHAALQSPERVQGLVLMLPPAVWEARSAQAAVYRRAVQLCASLGPARFARLIASEAGVPAWLLRAAPHLRAAMRDGILIPHLYGGAALSDLPSRADLAVLAAVPALIVAWPDDPAHPLASAQELHRLLPRSTLMLAATHDDVQSIPAALHRFLTRIGTPAALPLAGR
jgi:pimeloyl-ACP methyl ester carboxylesterase